MNPVEVDFQADAASDVRWHVIGATVTTALNEPYVIKILVETEQLDTEPLRLLGSSSTVVIRRGTAENTYGGIVSSVQVVHHHQRTVRAALIVEPALAALRHGRDTRIFQDKSVPTVLEEVLTGALRPYGREARVELMRSYPEREYTVQYQESDFDFVHRLMEEEGILYRFDTGEGGVETLVLSDAPQQHPLILDDPMLEYSEEEASTIGRETLRAFDPISTVVGTQVAMRHFDWTNPDALIEGQSDATHESEAPNGSAYGPMRESYQHDEQLTLHGYASSYRANDIADQPRLRRETQARDSLVFRAHGSVARIRAGVRFEVNAHPTVELNDTYVVISATHRFGSHRDPEAMGADAEYSNRFRAVRSDVAYRPRRVRPRPRVHGIQTAIVTGPDGEEIHTDEHGRVKVQFHWDRVGEMNDRTTCWIRCMQSWAGPGWGAWVLPRVGMEVVVSFIDGDLDRPLVTGSVYNGKNGTPYALPDKKMVSTFKTNSYPGGDGYNELRFDDTKGGEEIWMHGEKDWNTVIEHDLTRTVHNDETQTVDRNRMRRVGINEGVLVGANQSTTVGLNRVVQVGMHKIVTAGESIDLRCGKSRIVMDKEGVIRIEGTELRLGASNEVWIAGKLIHLN
ncbi:MAG: type VI secretion system Vgr family protein [Sandaracinaceae bacterium]